MFLVFSAVRYKFVLTLAVILALANIFMVVNHQFAKHHHKECDNDIIDNGKAFFGDLRRLQIEINKTFEIFEEIKRVAGKAFDKASLYKRHHRRKPRKQVQSEGRSIPLVPDCKQPPFLLIMIHSTPANVMEREAIRLSWGRPENSINKVTTETQHSPRFVNKLKTNYGDLLARFFVRWGHPCACQRRELGRGVWWYSPS